MKHFEFFSPEIIKNLKKYEEILKKWQKKINLISASSLSNLWERHFLDSAQLYPLLPRTGKVLDFGSGAGFPALVLAVIAQGQGADLVFYLVESDVRKGEFLKEVVRILGLKNVQILSDRIEHILPFSVDIITARALANLAELVDFARPFATLKTHALFIKGQGVDEEIKALKMSLNIFKIPSQTAPQGVILDIQF